MYLILEVISANAAALSGTSRKVLFSVDGGRIGRAADNDFVLPGVAVHRHHATIRFINGVFFIEGEGANGIAVNNPEVVLPRNEPYPLKSGDKIFIDEFEVSVTATSTPPVEMPEPQTARTQPPADDLLELTGHHPGPSLNLTDASDDLDPLSQLNAGGAARPQATVPPEQNWNHSSALSDHFSPSPVSPTGAPGPAQAIPEDWNRTTFNKSKLQPTPTPTPPVMRPAPPRPAPAVHANAAPPAEGAFDWESFLRSAGVDPAAVPADSAAILGHIMRSVVQGLIEVLRARSEIKTEFRMAVTQVKVSENNPLKFAANAEDALVNLFGRRNPAYLPPREAFDDALNDVRFHQLAMLVGVRAGFDHLMSRFDPEQLNDVFAKRSRGGLFGGKAKHWAMYEERFKEMAADSDETFRRLFGEEFARAYERQLAELKRASAKR